MSLFKKNIKEEKTNVTIQKNNPPLSRKELTEYYHKKEKPDIKIIKKKRIGFKPKEKKPIEKEKIKEKEEPIITENTDDVIEELLNNEGEPLKTEEDDKEKTPFSMKKKKALIKKDMKGKPVFLEDTGEKLGIVQDSIYDKDNNLTGYKIKDKRSDSVLSFPIEQFDFNKDGLIFIPGWYNNALRIIEKLEFKDKISPELTALISDDDLSNEELYDIFIKHDNEMVQYIDDAKSLKEMISGRLKVLEKQRIALKDDLMDLTEKRLIKDIDRRKFSEDVMTHRRKVNVLDVNINKCHELLNRLDKTSFGTLGKNNLLHDKKDNVKTKPNLYESVLNLQQKPKRRDIPTYPKENEKDEYKEKYFALKQEFDQLEEDYNELKIAVDKLFNRDELL